MESGSGLECFRPASPRLQRALDEYGTSLSDSSVKIAESIGPFSCNDTWTMTPDMFTSVSGGVQVIALAKTVVNATRSVPFAPGRALVTLMVFLKLSSSVFSMRGCPSSSHTSWVSFLPAVLVGPPVRRKLATRLI